MAFERERECRGTERERRFSEVAYDHCLIVLMFRDLLYYSFTIGLMFPDHCARANEVSQV